MRRFLNSVSRKPLINDPGLSYTILIDEALPSAASDEVTSLDISSYTDIIALVKDASISSNGGIYLEFGDVTDYTTNVTLDGGSFDDNGAILWSTTGGLAFSPTKPLAQSMTGGFHMTRLPTVLAESFYGSGWQAWQVQGIVGGSAAGDLNRMGGVFATNKTIDRARISATAGTFDAGRWGLMGRT